MNCFGVLYVFLSVTIQYSHGQIPHIVGGRIAEPHSHPWLLSLHWVANGEEITVCSASLLPVPYSDDSSDMVLTAARCILGVFGESSCENRRDLFEQFAVIASQHDLDLPDRSETHRKVIDGQCLEGFTMDGYRDIAVLKLQEPVPFGETVRPIDLPASSIMGFPISDCRVGGWGATGQDEKRRTSFTRFLKEADVRIAYKQECDAFLRSRNRTYYFEAFLCEMHKSTDHVSNGDSGGALTCIEEGKRVLSGIVGHVDTKCDEDGTNCKTATIFTKVGNFQSWTREQIVALHEESDA